MKNKWLLYLVLFLLAVNAALLSVYLIESKTEQVETQSERKEGRKKERSKHGFEYHLAEKLGFTEQQISDVGKYRDQFKKDRRANRLELEELRKEYSQLLLKGNVDTLQLNAIAKRRGLLEVEKLKMEYAHYQNIRSVCTPEQALQMDSLGRVHMSKQFKEMGSGHERRRDCSDSEKLNNKINSNEK